MPANPRRPKDSPIKVEPGKETDKHNTCKAFKNPQEYTYSKTEDYKQKKILGLDTVEPLKQTSAKQDDLLMKALNKDLSKRNLH